MNMMTPRHLRAVKPRALAALRSSLILSHLKLVERARDGLGGPRAEPNLLGVFFRFDGSELRLPLALKLSDLVDILGNPLALKQFLKQKILGLSIQLDLKPTIETRPKIDAKTDSSRTLFSGEARKFSKGEEQPIPSSFGRFDVELLNFSLDVDVSLIEDAPLSVVLGTVLGTVETAVEQLIPELPLPAPAFGVVYALIERDLSGASTIAAAHQAFKIEVSKVLNGIGASLDAGSGLTLKQVQSDPEVIAKAVKDAAFAEAIRSLDFGSVVNRDDTLGSRVHAFSPLRSGDIDDNFSDAETGKHGQWRLRGAVGPLT